MSKRKQKGTPKSKISSNPKVYKEKISLVIPCYNESKRIPQLLSELKKFALKWTGAIEIILVDDGSTDDSVTSIQSTFPTAFGGNIDFHLLELGKNQGKGAALKAGIAAATGEHILTLDADMATSPLELQRWLRKCNTFPTDKILIASREHQDSKVEGNIIRRIAGLVYNFIIQLFTNINLSDTQCGFKLYPKGIAKPLFENLQSKGWAHDVELLYQAKLEDISVEPMPVQWKHQEDSKISLFVDSFKMFWQTLAISTRLKWNWFVSKPIADLRNKVSNTSEPSYYRLLFVGLALLLLIMMPLLSFDFGITGDEEVQKVYGEKVLSYFETNGQDSTALSYKNLYYYGGLFDYSAAWANKNIGGLDPYDMRHLLNALVGFLMILFTGFLAKEITGSWRMAFFALLFMAVSPRIFGHSMNNPKDIPFAAAYVFSMLYMIRFIKEMPRPSNKTIIMLIIGIAAAINVRVGGILLIAYFGLFVLVNFFLKRNDFKEGKSVLKLGIIGVFVVLGAYFGGLLFWPYGLQAPFSNPLKALGEMSNFSTGIRMLFNGEHLWSDELPWYYIPKWIGISAPLFLLAGLILFIVFYFMKFKKINNVLLGMVAFTAIFPVAYAIYKHSSLYDGMRHFLFVYPMLIVLCAWGWHQLMKLDLQKSAKLGTSIVLALLVALPTIWMIRNHPHQYTYFNELSGGLKGAYGKYETDYWMNSMKGLCEWLVENDARIKNGEKVIIRTNCTLPVKYYMSKLAPNVAVGYVRYNDRIKTRTADYYMFFSRFVNKDLLKNGAWPPEDVVYTENAGGVVLGAITKHDDNSDTEAAEAEKQKDWAKAIPLYEKAVQINPKHEAALFGLANCYLNTGNMPKLKETLDKSLALSDTYINNLNMLGQYHLRTNNLQAGLETYQKINKLNYKYALSYYYMAAIHQQQGQLDKAIEIGKNMQKHAPSFKPGYELMARIYQQKGDNNTAQKYLEYVKRLK